MSKKKEIKITQVKSGIASTPNQRANLNGLGFTKKIGQTLTRIDTPEIRGMINKVSHLVRVEEA